VNKKRQYYVLFFKKGKNVVICTAKSCVSRHLNVHRITIYRWLEKTNVYENDEIILWQYVVIQYATRG